MNSAQGHDLSDVLNLTPKQVSTGLALFYVCYVIFDCPSNLIMSKLSPHVWMSRIVLSVGIIGTCMTAMKAAWSLYLLRLLLGVVIAGMWPGMTYYLSLYYPPSRCARRIGHYYTAAQLSAAVVGLVSAGFQKMDGLGGLVGFQWMFLIYGLLAIILGIVLLWWLPDRPHPPTEKIEQPVGWRRLLPRSPPVLTGEDARIHYEELTRVYHRPSWGWKDLGRVLIDWRLWPLVIMYFGVVGVGMFLSLFTIMTCANEPKQVSVFRAMVPSSSTPSTPASAVSTYPSSSHPSGSWISSPSSSSLPSATASTPTATSSSVSPVSSSSPVSSPPLSPAPTTAGPDTEVS
jgi:MFS family permease